MVSPPDVLANLLQGKLLGIDEFLFAPARERPRPGLHRALALDQPAERSAAARAAGRIGTRQNPARIERRRTISAWFCPKNRATAAEAFLEAAAAEIAALSDGSLKLLWSVTENLGDWSDVRRRLTEQMDHRRGTPGFRSRAEDSDGEAQEYFAHQLGMKLRDAESAGWSPETPGRIQIGEGKHVWSLAGSRPSASVRAPRRAQRRRARAGIDGRARCARCRA